MSRPPRKGQPYTDEDHTEIIRLLKEGASTAEIAAELGRETSSVTNRMRRLLPADQRRCPSDVVESASRRAANQEGFDWRQTIVQDEPLPPIKRVNLSGVQGLHTDQLVTLLHSLAITCDPQDHELLTELTEAANSKLLASELAERHRSYLSLRDRGTLAHTDDAAEAWAHEVLGRRKWASPYPTFANY